MREVSVTGNSFPEAVLNAPIELEKKKLWQVLCGDKEHWRCGLYSPVFSTRDEINELECHTCPELFVLIEGSITLLLYNKQKGFYELDLELNIPSLITDYHCGFCKDGKYSGKALVIERDIFKTIYKTLEELHDA